MYIVWRKCFISLYWNKKDAVYHACSVLKVRRETKKELQAWKSMQNNEILEIVSSNKE